MSPFSLLDDQDPAALRAQLDQAMAATQRAYRDSSRLIRLLAAMGDAAAPAVLTDRVLGALSEVFSADVVCLAYPDTADPDFEGEAGVVHIEAARGFPEGEEPSIPGLAVAPARAFRGAPMSWECPPDREPPEVAGLPVRATAVVPMSATDVSAGTLFLFRQAAGGFESTELPMLQSVAVRLHASLEEAERREAIERLARTAHRFTRHLEVGPLFEDAATLLCEMTGAERAVVVGIESGNAVLRTPGRLPEEAQTQWPIPLEHLQAWTYAQRGESFTSADIHGGAGSPVVPVEVRSLRAVLCVPIMGDGGPVALLYAFHSRPGFFTRTSVDSATALAGSLTSALANTSLVSALSVQETELRQLTGELQRRATHDPLTGLANRDLARDLLESSLAARQPDQVGLLFCDLDKFKAINDRLGHEAGDDLLRQVATRLAACVRGHDLLARLGGDEFLVVLPTAKDLDMVTSVGARVLEALEAPFELAGEQVRVTASVGGVVGDRGPAGATAVELLRDADAAMYAAKNRGRGRVEVFDRFTAESAVQRLALREELQSAVQRDELELDYQPIVSLQDRRIIGFEALLRWNHPRIGRIPPADFIPMAEETGAIGPIGWWALCEASRQLAAWQTRFTGSLSMSVNVSALQLLDPVFPERTCEVIQGAGLRLRDVWIEITESVPMNDELIGRLGRLRASGVRVAMDDFGTSYSNLGYLKRMPVERLKIDREFVRGLGTGGSADPSTGLEERIDRGIVKAVVAISESAGMSVVAEGIETEEQRRVLLELGVRRGQGYLFAPPRPPAAVAETLGSHAGLVLA